MATWAVCAILRNEEQYVLEWLAYHLLQGADRFLVYDNGSTDRTLELVASASRHCNITVIDWRPEGNFDYIQRSAYLDGARRLAGVVDFVAFIDCDEFVSATEGTVKDALRVFQGSVSALAINQLAFGSNGLLTNQGGLVTSRFTKCSVSDAPMGYWIKTIARPERVKDVNTVHSVIVTEGDYVLNDGSTFSAGKHPGRVDRIGAGSVKLFHYQLKSKEEFGAKTAKWSRVGGYFSERFRDADKFFRDNDSISNATENRRISDQEQDIVRMISILSSNPKIAE